MSLHNYNTRISTGKLKRKIINDDMSGNSDNDCEDDDYIDDIINQNEEYLEDEDYDDDEDDDEDDEDDEDDQDDEDDEDNKNHKRKNKNLAKDKLAYYKFLNKIFPSKYTKSKINSIKRQRLNNLIYLSKNNHQYDNNYENQYGDYDDYDYDNDEDELEHEYNEDEDEEDDDDGDDENKLFVKKNLMNLLNKSHSPNNINIVLLKKGNNKIYNYDNSKDNDMYLCNKPENDSDNESLDVSSNKFNSNEENVVKDINDVIPPPKSDSKKNYTKFNKILEEQENEEDYFKKELSINGQNNAISQLSKIKQLTTIEKPYLLHLVELDIPNNYKACALRKINTLRSMGCGFGNSEYFKIKSWVDTFIKIPFNKYNNLPICFADGIDKCHDFMEDAKKTLDNVVYGLEDAKIQIMQLIGLWLVNPNAVGSAIAIKGPMGTGKTTLIKEGISKILNRPFALIALGGCGDSGFLDGHDYTYEGSKYGRIVDVLINAQCMNPIILFDELDKVSDSPKGEEITGVLTHLTDVTQNTQFTDKYMSEITLNMSRALYIFSYNDENRVNPILKDRMYKIETKGYKTKDKLVISKNYLLPKIIEQSKFKDEDVVFDDSIIEYIINDFTEKESGVRNLKRCFETIFTKLNLYRLMKPDVNLFEESMKLKEKITFPFKINKEHIDLLINKNVTDKVPYGMYN
tara:strand:+ start:1522 stop:3582 length:2061 start_codon:yes stop_codon:yes gene_type:complete